MAQSHQHRHPSENYSFTFKCLAALTAIAAVIAVPLLIIPLLAVMLFFTFTANNRPATHRHAHPVREPSWFEEMSTFLYSRPHPYPHPTGHIHQHRKMQHHHPDSYHSNLGYEPHHHGFR